MGLFSKENTFKKITRCRVTEDILEEAEEDWQVELPKAYRDFMKKHNGGIPEKKAFECNGDTFEIEVFLCILEDPN